ncbi:putative periplasmic protein [Salmonella enterica subsp. enterica]|uniref:Putative periplasmic protein n=1 Tax=Salmonella enterica I TaxID=59201 RepID=A0A379WRH6_SALET|nr:putative periplasmic protein [Salmonella enterica subsp. enterica]
MAIYDGAEWYSDFKQRDMWAGPGYGQPGPHIPSTGRINETFSLVALILLLCSCSAPHHDSTQAVKQFYTSWMTTFTNDVNTPDDTTALMQRYVAKEVIHRLALIQSLYEQEIVGADYFMYAQDYAPEWIPQLRVGKAHPFLGGEKVDVLLATESTPIHLEVYTRWEEGRWKIYRVRDADKDYEQPIYDAGAITRLRPGQRKSRGI